MRSRSEDQRPGLSVRQSTRNPVREWSVLDEKLNDNAVRKALGDKKFTSLTPVALLARLREKVARKAAADAAAAAAAAAAGV